MNDEARIEDGEEEELDLSTLDDDELVKQMHDDLYDGLREEIVEGTNILLSRSWGPKKLLDEALVEGMRIVGIDFRDGILFVPEVLLAAKSMMVAPARACWLMFSSSVGTASAPVY